MRGGLGLAGLLLLAASISAQAATLHVPAQYNQIQFAVNAAQPGDTVLVAPGTYTYVFQPPGADTCAVAMKSGITLLGSGQGQTIIDPQRLGRGIYCNGVTNARIGRLTVKRAFGQVFGAGIYCVGNSSPAVFDCEVTLCGDGGIICNLGASPAIDHCTLTNNLAKEGGGIACEAGSSPVVTHCTIRGNSAPSGGGAYAKSGSAPRFEHCVIEQNSLSTVNGSGGGMGVVNATVTVRFSRIADNTATGTGGGVAVFDNAVVTFESTDIEGNSTGGDYGPGGGIYCESSDLTLTNCTIVENMATSPGSDGGGIFAFFAGQMAITGSTIARNGTNSNALGGGITCAGSSPAIQRTIIAFNSPGKGMLCTDGSSQPAVSCSDLYGNAGGNQICGVSGTGNFSLDPRFCDMAASDYTLHRNSPCLDNQHPNGLPCGQIGARGLGTCDGIAVEDPGAPGLAGGRVVAAPNPFATGTALRFRVASAARVGLAIYDAAGRRVRVLEDGVLGAGEHRSVWGARDGSGRPVPSGVYFYRLIGDGPERSGCLVLAR